MDVLREALVPLEHEESVEAALEAVGDARWVLIGEASHGTREFYAFRAALTRRLIERRGFAGVAVEADWPDAWRAGRYALGGGGERDADGALSGFKRFPTWMWRNTVVRDFMEWLRQRNLGVPEEQRAGFYGMDLYSLHASMEAVLAYLGKVDPAAAARARARYAGFDHFGPEAQEYGRATAFNLEASCEDEVVAQLRELRRAAAEFLARDGRVARDDYFQAEQNARLVKNAEEYYRSMFRGSVHSWNLRDTHMTETLESLRAHLSHGARAGGGAPRIAVWAHNSHLGDARATDMGRAGEHNVGQLLRERYGNEVFSLGFTTHTGWVTAARDWGEAALHRHVRPSLPGSHERVFHELADELGIRRFFLPLRDREVARALVEPRLERAIGVIYRPETERGSHYFHARLPAQFDAVVHFDETHALVPLDHSPHWTPEEVAETYPTGI